jgi:hypothetical protein
MYIHIFCFILFTLYLPFQVCNRVSVIGTKQLQDPGDGMNPWLIQEARWELPVVSISTGPPFSQFQPIHQEARPRQIGEQHIFRKNRCISTESPCADFAHRITGIIFAWVFKCHAAYRCIVTYIARTQCFIIISPCRPKDSWTLSMSNSTPCIFVSSKVCQYRDFGFRKWSRVWISRYVTPQLLSGRSTIIQHHIFKTCPDHTKSGH